MILGRPKVSLRNHQAKRVTTGSVAGLGQSDVTVTWDAAFTDTSYTVVVSVEDDTAGDGLRVRRIRTKTTTEITVNVRNDSAGALTGTLHAIAVKD